jgi:hypothetical protein
MMAIAITLKEQQILYGTSPSKRSRLYTQLFNITLLLIGRGRKCGKRG